MPISDEKQGKLGATTAERQQKLEERRERRKKRKAKKKAEGKTAWFDPRRVPKRKNHPPKHVRELRAACTELCLRVACEELYSAVERCREERDEIKGASITETSESEESEEDGEKEGEGEGEDMEEGEDGEDEAEREKVRELVEMSEREMAVEEEETDA